MKEEILRIMKLVEEGKIDSEKAAELIEALKAPSVEQSNTINSDSELMLKIRVVDDEDNVNVTLPVKFIKGIIASCGKIPMNINGMESIDTNMLLQAIDSGLKGKIVDVQSANGGKVEVTIE